MSVTSSLAVPAAQRATPVIRPRVVYLCVAILLATMAFLLVASVRQESQIMDESAHIYSGFEYWKHADFGENPEHPPMAKLVAALPLLSMGLHEPAIRPGMSFKAGEFINAKAFLYSGHNADAILQRARLAMLLFPLSLGLLVFLAGQEMFNPVTGLIALFLCVFETVILANGPLVTTDMPLTATFFAAVYTFYRYVKAPSLLRLAVCALATALCITAKHSGLLIAPVLILLSIADLFASERSGTAQPPRAQRARQLGLAVLGIAGFSYLFLWAIYGFRYAARPGQFVMIPSLASYSTALPSALARSLIDFVAHHHLAPEAYLFGWVDILRLPGIRPLFLFGHVYAHGLWYYFPVMLLVKSSITLILLLALLPFARIRQHRRELLFLILPAAFFLSIAIGSRLNLGVRHVLPIYPFWIVLAGAAAAWFALRSMPARVVIAALLVFAAISSLRSSPDFLAYSNELVGGPSQTYRVVDGSNADWGQGFKWTKAYLDRHPAPECWFDSYDSVIADPAYYGIPCKPLLSGFGALVGQMSVPPKSSDKPALAPTTLSGTILLSATDLDGTRWGPDELNPYASFRDRKPDDIIGNVILVYRGTFDLPLLAARTNAETAQGLLGAKRVAEALSVAETAAQEAPDSARVQQVLGNTLIASHRTAEAKQVYARAVHLARTNHPEFQQSIVDQIEGQQLLPY